jgi:hypothetical protein
VISSTGEEVGMKRSVFVMLFLSLIAAMALPVAGIGTGPAQACETDKEPPPK